MNIKLIEFTIKSLQRNFVKKIAVIFVFTFLVFLLVSVLSISSSIKKVLEICVNELPELIIQKMSGGRQTLIPTDRIYDIIDIAGISNVQERIWGYYYFKNENVNFTLVGIDFDLQYYKTHYNDIINFYSSKIDSTNTAFIITGEGINKLLEKNFYKNYFVFDKVTGGKLESIILGTFKSESNLETNDVILMPQNYVREIFGISENLSTDIVVQIPNPSETEIVKQKLQNMFPDCRIVSRNDIESSYQNIFDYKTGIFLALFLTAFVSFFILIYDKASGLSKEDQREIGILKAVGWQTENILQMKFLEGILISIFSFFLGTGLALFYVFNLQAPLLRNLFTGVSNLKPQFQLLPTIDFNVLFLIFILTVPVYILATLIPSWRAAIIDADEVLR
ncbi:MAG: FtsX-like permease family protein [Ignavibacteriae bacterium]|nr:FtsX-like permease family protein [Ignavibacteriota bacterium]